MQYCNQFSSKAAAFCIGREYSDEELSDGCRNLVGSLLHSLTYKAPVIPEDVRSALSMGRPTNPPPNYEWMLLTPLKSLIETFDAVYIVVDMSGGITRRYDLATMVDYIAGWKSKSLHLLVLQDRIVHSEGRRPTISFYPTPEPEAPAAIRSRMNILPLVWSNNPMRSNWLESSANAIAGIKDLKFRKYVEGDDALVADRAEDLARGRRSVNVDTGSTKPRSSSVSVREIWQARRDAGH